MYGMVAVIAGRPDLESSSKLFFPLLNYVAHFSTVAKSGASSTIVSTMSAWISVGVNPFFASILGHHDARFYPYSKTLQSPQ